MQAKNKVYIDPQKIPNYAWDYLGSAAYDMVQRLKTDPATREMFAERKAKVVRRAK